MPRKAALTTQRKQKLINTLRSASAAAWHARRSVNYHLRKDDVLYKEIADIYARLRSFESRAASRLQLPRATEIGFPPYAIRRDGTLPR
jgi:hypothetical protein